MRRSASMSGDKLKYVFQNHARALYLLVPLFNYTPILSTNGDTTQQLLSSIIQSWSSIIHLWSSIIPITETHNYQSSSMNYHESLWLIRSSIINRIIEFWFWGMELHNDSVLSPVVIYKTTENTKNYPADISHHDFPCLTSLFNF